MHSFKELIKTFKTYSCNDALSAPQLRRAFSDLEIPQENLTDPDGQMYRVLSRVKNSKKMFFLNKLLLISILLGDGTNEEKAEWLFRQYDADASDELDYSELENMVKDLMEVIIYILPVIGIGQGVGSFTEEECEEFIKKMQENQETIEKEILSDLKAQSMLTHDQFIELMKDGPRISKVLSPYQVREALTRDQEELQAS